MTDKNKAIENRRKLLKSVAAGGGAIIAGKTLPDTWTKPAVDSIILPAHAQTSNGPFSGTSVVALLDSDADSLLASAMETVVPQANAVTTVRDLSWCIEPNADATAANVFFLLTESMGGYICHAYFWEKTNVPANATTDLGFQADACVSLVDAGEWLNNLGLINDAHASGQASVTLTSLAPGSSFTFTESGGTPEVNTLSVGPCGDRTANCQPGKCGY